MIGRLLARSILRDVPWDKCPTSFDAEMRERWLAACCRSNGCSDSTTRRVVAEWKKQTGGADSEAPKQEAARFAWDEHAD